MKTNSTIESLQVLRGIAASAVVLHHTIRAVLLFSSERNDAASAHWLAEWLAIGVDIFFVISGFIMVYISTPYLEGKKPLNDFVMMRIIRIYPIYFTATFLLLTIQTVSFLLSSGVGFNLSLRRILSALVLFPSFNQKGLVQPVLGVGWTLSYEILFYITFYISICLAKKANLLIIIISTILISINITTNIIPEWNLAINSFLKNRIMFEFIFGCGIAMAYMKGLAQRLPVWPLFVLSVISLFLSLTADGNADNRFFLWGFPATMLVFLFLQIDRRMRWPRFLVLLGEASYSIYIFHTLILYFLLMPIISHLHIDSVTHLDKFLTISVVWCLLIASTLLAHLVFERPLQAHLVAAYRAGFRNQLRAAMTPL
ncbi:MAG TPA: acyltransferase [Methylophilaceae bacterium]|jgi:peptidoglycan/LPS O-acetylase OafA/YrhL